MDLVNTGCAPGGTTCHISDSMVLKIKFSSNTLPPMSLLKWTNEVRAVKVKKVCETWLLSNPQQQ